jgi:YggT family protein
MRPQPAPCQEAAAAAVSGHPAGPDLVCGHAARYQAIRGAMDPIQRLIYTLLDLYLWAVIISVIMSWLYQFNVVNRSNQFVNAIASFLYAATEPALRPIRRYVPSIGGMDVSPLVLILGISFLQWAVIYYWPM